MPSSRHTDAKTATTMPMLSEQDIERLLAARRRQRFVEYVSLVSMQGFLAAGLIHATHLTSALGIAPFTFVGAWMLASLREERRTRNQHDTKRLLGDTLESFGMALAVAIFGIAARWFGVPGGVIMTYLSVGIGAYFLGSFCGETWWQSRNFARLSMQDKVHYMTNFNRSIIFPYNIRYLRSALRSTSQTASRAASSAKPSPSLNTPNTPADDVSTPRKPH
jgi:hypothetical protein